jgi:hypothetical protein
VLNRRDILDEQIEGFKELEENWENREILKNKAAETPCDPSLFSKIK